jgi:hypothetical protein
MKINAPIIPRVKGFDQPTPHNSETVVVMPPQQS